MHVLIDTKHLALPLIPNQCVYQPLVFLFDLIQSVPNFYVYFTVLVDFCKLAIDFLISGGNHKKYNIAAGEQTKLIN